ncbi:MAG TPA: single-stranded-DNA-specific exonuclease RecJ [Thermoanaerobaculia bacterium]|nr:single-stranded-DNA-specific exonuclease RecJ [Thermoanaerobaculia bacterium]
MTIHEFWAYSPATTGGSDLPVAPTLAPIFGSRGITTASELDAWCNPTLDGLHDPVGIGGMEAAAERILRAVRDREPILIYGDYDVDGVTSIVLMRTVLRALGADVDFVVPHRVFDGYGLKSEVIDRVLRDRAVKLVVTVDCGITSVEPVAEALEKGIDVIITDHHLPPGMLPSAAAVLNPKQAGCDYPYKDLAGVGVAFKLCCELLRRSRHSMSIGSLVKIAAIGTIADVAPLTGENRALVRLGLAGLADPRNPGLRALIRSLGLLGRPLRASDIGFRIGPRINAAGRLASANTAIDLFDAKSESAAEPLVAELNRLNRERQAIENAVLAEAEAMIAEMGELPPILVVWGEGWHRGVVGLCAGRLAQRYNRPALAIARDGEECVGSARSVSSIDLHAALEEVSDLFTRFGGHAHACGFSLHSDSLQPLRRRLIERFASTDRSLFVRSARVDAEVTLQEMDRTFAADHERLEPFGQENPQPLLMARGVDVESVREFSPGCHRLTLRQTTRRMPAVAWPSVASLGGTLTVGNRIDLLFRLEPDRYDEFRLEVVDAAPTGSAPVAHS